MQYTMELQHRQLLILLGEKERLLKEIHHRVKNNLQIAISLLNTQSAYLESEEARSAIRNSLHRMHAMSLIHQKLYQSHNLSSVDMQWYIQELVTYMCDAFPSEKNIHFIPDIENMQIDVGQAVPLGLIMNEAISNCIQYAFPHSTGSEVHISLKNRGGNLCELQIADNGIGLPSAFDAENGCFPGMNLMRGLSEQLKGNFCVSSHHGVTIIVTFALITEFPAAHIL